MASVYYAIVSSNKMHSIHIQRDLLTFVGAPITGAIMTFDPFIPALSGGEHNGRDNDV